MDTEAKMIKQETDVERINKLLDSLHGTVSEIRERTFTLHEPSLRDTVKEAKEPTELVGRRIISSLEEMRDRLQEALEALKGFN